MNIMPNSLIASALLAGFALISASSASAQINYQGRLTDAAGAALADGQYTLQFTLWDAATGGNKLWGPYVADGGPAVGHGPKAAVVDGRFNIVIGDRDTVEVFMKDKLATSLSTYLQIQVGTSAPISPRQVILPAPRALVADVLPNVVPNANGVTLSGNVVVQDKTDLTKQLMLAYNTNTNGNYGSIQAKQGATHNNLILNPDGGSVGIGTSTPAAKLDVAGALQIASMAQQSMGPNGYVQIGELIIQWGEESSNHDISSGSTTVMTFPKQFPTQVFVVLPGMRASPPLGATIYVKSNTLSQVTFVWDEWAGVQSIKASYIAIGR